MSSKSSVWTTVAEDYNSPLTRNEIWTRGMARYPEFLGTDAVTIGIVGRDGNINYIADMNSWQHVHEQLKAKALKENIFVEKLIDKALAFGEETNRWSQKNIQDVSLTKASQNKLIQLYRAVYEREETLYALGTGLVILDFHDFSFIEGNLKKFLNPLSEAKQKECFMVFTEPIQNSFAQDQEEDLLKLMRQWFEEENWKATVQNESLENIKKLFPTFYKQLHEHTKKHCWVYYVYAGPAFTEDDFLNFIKEYLKKATIPPKKLKELDEKKKKMQELKEQYIQELGPDKFQETIIRLAGKVVWAKPRRKDFQSRTYYHLEKLQREIGARLHLSLKEVRHMPLTDVETALTAGEINREKIKQAIQFHAFIHENKGIKFLYGKSAEEFYKSNVETKRGEIKEVSTIKGACACKGNARGIVKIINTPADMKKMNEGDILVSIATTPSIIAAMKKAAAFITDEGGLTCHASIVSRELNTPCVVGTKVATKVLKDGDVVEVDATNGVIRKL